MRYVRSLAMLTLGSLLASCSGGGSSGPGSTGLPGGSTGPGAGSTSGSRAKATLRLTIPVYTPSARKRRTATVRRPAYISPSTLGAILTATSTTTAADNASYGYDLSTAGVCTGGDGTPIVCTLSFPLFAGTYSIHVAAYDHNEDGTTAGAGSPAAPAGNVLSQDTETETVVLGANNQFTNFLLHAVVASFATAAPQPIGATGGSPLPSPTPVRYFNALDADGNNVDAYGNATTYANGPFAVNVQDLGDISGCANPCTTATNTHGTSPSGTPATIDALADLMLAIAYDGGGGPGAGVKNWRHGGAPPTGQGPYEGRVTAAGPTPATSASINVVPLFAYPTSLAITNGIGYVWAAQAAPPVGANANTGSYSAYFTTPGTSMCTATGGQPIATLGSGTYYPGYGEVFPVTAGVNGTCTLTLSDGGSPADTVSVAVTIGTPSSTVSVPCPQGTFPPTGSSVKRRSITPAVSGGSVQLVQYALGVSQATLPNPVTAGNTLVVIIGDNPGTPNLPAAYTLFTNATDNFGYAYTRDVTTSGSIGALSSGDGCNTAMWIAEFSGSTSAAIRSANAGAGATSTATTPSITPDAAGGLVITSFVGDDSAAATASSGYTEYFAHAPAPSSSGVPLTSLDVQLANAPTSNTTTPVSNTFGGAADPNGHAEIFQIAPASFTPP